jgi:hypothetical protein
VKILLQAVHVIDAGTDLRKGTLYRALDHKPAKKYPATKQNISATTAVILVTVIFSPLAAGGCHARLAPLGAE